MTPQDPKDVALAMASEALIELQRYPGAPLLCWCPVYRARHHERKCQAASSCSPIWGA